MDNHFSSYGDSELAELLKSEDKVVRDGAFTEIYDRHSPRILLYCKRAAGDEMRAEDIFQETFIRFLRSINDTREITNVPAYLLRIARNLCLNAKRDERPSVPIEDFQIPYEDTRVEDQELTKLVAMSLDLLPEEYREALTLQIYGGLSYQEIGESMGVPVTTIRNWIVRAKQKMQEILAPYYEEQGL